LGRCEAYLDRRIEEDGIFQSDSAEEAAD